MALINCPHCGHYPLSDKAVTCPKCKKALVKTDNLSTKTNYISERNTPTTGSRSSGMYILPIILLTLIILGVIFSIAH